EQRMGDTSCAGIPCRAPQSARATSSSRPSIFALEFRHPAKEWPKSGRKGRVASSRMQILPSEQAPCSLSRVLVELSRAIQEAPPPLAFSFQGPLRSVRCRTTQIRDFFPILGAALGKGDGHPLSTNFR